MANEYPICTEELHRTRFWAKVLIKEPNACWPWLGAKSIEGYGILIVCGKQLRANRIALVLKLNKELQGLALHLCDNPICVNPNHLYEGDNKRNTLDSIERGRRGNQAGERNASAKLTHKDIVEIKKRLALKVETQTEIAASFGVNSACIWKIKVGLRWKNIT